MNDEVVALSTQLHKELPSDQVPRKILEIFFDRYGKEETYRYICNLSRTDPGAVLHHAYVRFPIDTMASMSDEEIFDTIKENFWHIFAMRSNIRNFFGVAPIGPLYAIWNRVSSLESTGAKMALYPSIEGISNAELIELYQTVMYNRTQETNYRPQTKHAQEVCMIQESVASTETLRSQYGRLVYMFREIHKQNLAWPENAVAAISVSASNRRLLWHLLNRLKYYITHYQTTPEYLTLAIQLIDTTVSQIEIGRKTELYSYREVLHNLMFGNVAKEEAMKVLTLGNFFSRTRSEANAIAWSKNSSATKETSCSTTSPTLSKLPNSAAPRLNSGGVLLSAS